MTTELTRIPEKNLLFVDIETVSSKKDINSDSPEFDMFSWKNRNKDTDELPDSETVSKIYRERAALNPIYGKIVCITVGFIHSDVIYIQTFHGEEKTIIQDFVDLCHKNTDKTLCIWNASFDLPYIRKRAMICGLDNYLSNKIGNDAMKKPWTLDGVLDLMDVWKGIWFYNDSMEEVAYGLGLSSPKEDLRGSEVSFTYYDEGVERIIKYCEQDVICLSNIYRKLTYQSPVEEVIVKTKEVEKPLPLLKRIFSLQRATKEEIEELKDLIESSDLDKKVVNEIITTVFRNNVPEQLKF